MASCFDEQKWQDLIQKPDWYLEIVPQLTEIKKEAERGGREMINKYKEELYSFFERHLQNGTIALGSEIGNWDTERKQIDTIIIHHTQNPPGITKERLSAMELVRLYAPVYANPNREGADVTYGKPISSGHIRDGKQVFYPYHWVIRNDGRAEQHLFDNETGWHAGNWDINCRSVAIVFDNDYSRSRPSDRELDAVARLISSKYPNVSRERIFGHCEINIKKTHCPSGSFLAKDGHVGWKEDLLARIVSDWVN